MKKAECKTPDQWMELVTTCRASGMSDKAWCDHNNIPISTFYNAVHRLRRKNYQIPEQTNCKSIIDLTTTPDVVKVDIVDTESGSSIIDVPKATQHIDNSYTMEISIGGAIMRLTNDVDPKVAGRLIRAIGGSHAC